MYILCDKNKKNLNHKDFTSLERFWKKESWNVKKAYRRETVAAKGSSINYSEKFRKIQRKSAVPEFRSTCNFVKKRIQYNCWEATLQRWYEENMFSNYAANLQENAHAEVLFQ